MDDVFVVLRKPAEGSISYTTSSLDQQCGPAGILIDENTKVTFTTYALGIAKMGFARIDGDACDFKNDVHVLRDDHDEVTPEGVKGIGRYFFLCVEHDYDVYVDGVKFFVLRAQKQHIVQPLVPAKRLRALIAQKEADRLARCVDGGVWLQGYTGPEYKIMNAIESDFIQKIGDVEKQYDVDMSEVPKQVNALF
jgi:hypothetical protein